MGLLTKLAELLSSDRVTIEYINDIVDDVYGLLGTTINGRGSLTWENLAADAEILPSQIADTAVVRTNLVGPGEQIVTRPTAFHALTNLGLDPSTGSDLSTV